MEYLNKTTILQAVDLCETLPGYRALIAVYSRKRMLWVFSQIPRTIKAGLTITHSSGSILMTWKNGSVLRIIEYAVAACGYRVDTLIVDEEINDEARSIVYKPFLRKYYYGGTEMTIRQNPDADYANKVRAKLKENDYYCPCQIDKNDDTKCMCKLFRDQLDRKEPGLCHCGLYLAEVD